MTALPTPSTGCFLILAALLRAWSYVTPAVNTQHPSSPSHTLASEHSAGISEFMRTLYERGQFDGAVLVGGRNGVIYQHAFGVADRSRHSQFKTDTQSCLASVSKPFTALAVLGLVRNGTMHLDDHISQYVVTLPAAFQPVTIRHLLTHTSGVPDYGNLNIEHPQLTSAEVIQALRKIDHLQFPAGEKYEYSNSGYVLLSAAVEKVTGVAFPAYLQARFFGPLGMTKTFVLTDDLQKSSSVARGYNSFGALDDYDEFVTGDGGIYSTIGDLYLFDRALYGEGFLSKAERTQAFTPGRVRVGTTTYGFGWNIDETVPGKRNLAYGQHRWLSRIL